MGNRAVIFLADKEEAKRAEAGELRFTDINPQRKCIYVHWNGGRDSVEGFLAAAQELMPQQIRKSSPDEKTEWIANLLAENFFHVKLGESTIYLFDVASADANNGDNGTYIVNPDLQVCGRLFFSGPEQQENDPEDIKREIVKMFKLHKRIKEYAQSVQMDFDKDEPEKFFEDMADVFNFIKRIGYATTNKARGSAPFVYDVWETLYGEGISNRTDEEDRLRQFQAGFRIGMMLAREILKHQAKTIHREPESKVNHEFPSDPDIISPSM